MDTETNQTIYIDLIHFPIFTLGIGKRIGIWLQGCSIGCKGCISEHSWKATASHKTNIAGVIDKIKSYDSQEPEGITISGGEPFEQPEALYALLSYLKNSGLKGTEDIMIYSGYRYAFLLKKYPKILAMIDILVDGKFEAGNETSYIWKGSENQQMIILTENKNLKEKYMAYQQSQKEKRELQLLESDNNLLHIIGIPRQQDAGVIKNGIL